MLTKNFWSAILGGGVKTSDYEGYKVTTINKSYAYAAKNCGGLGQLLCNYRKVTTTDGLEYFTPMSTSSYGAYNWFRFCYFEDNKNLTDSQIYTLDGDIGYGTYTIAGKYRTIRSETSGNITGFRIVFDYKNETSNDIVLNTIKILNASESSISAYNTSTNAVFMVIQLDETITLKPEETYTFSYDIDNVFEDIPDSIV